MRIEFWFDFNCLSSYQTLKNLIEVLKDENEPFELLFRSFFIPLVQLDSNDHLLKDYYQDDYVDTFKAHELFHYAKRHHKELDVILDIFSSRFDLKRDIAQDRILLEIADNHHLNQAELIDIFNQHSFYKAIHSNYEHACLKKVDKAPYIKIDGQFQLSGYQMAKAIKNLIHFRHVMIKKIPHCSGEDCLRKQGI